MCNKEACTQMHPLHPPDRHMSWQLRVLGAYSTFHRANREEIGSQLVMDAPRSSFMRQSARASSLPTLCVYIRTSGMKYGMRVPQRPKTALKTSRIRTRTTSRMRSTSWYYARLVLNQRMLLTPHAREGLCMCRRRSGQRVCGVRLVQFTHPMAHIPWYSPLAACLPLLQY